MTKRAYRKVFFKTLVNAPNIALFHINPRTADASDAVRVCNNHTFKENSNENTTRKTPRNFLVRTVLGGDFIGLFVHRTSRFIGKVNACAVGEQHEQYKQYKHFFKHITAKFLDIKHKLGGQYVRRAVGSALFVFARPRIGTARKREHLDMQSVAGAR